MQRLVRPCCGFGFDKKIVVEMTNRRRGKISEIVQEWARGAALRVVEWGRGINNPVLKNILEAFVPGKSEACNGGLISKISYLQAADSFSPSFGRNSNRANSVLVLPNVKLTYRCPGGGARTTREASDGAHPASSVSRRMRDSAAKCGGRSA